MTKFSTYAYMWGVISMSALKIQWAIEIYMPYWIKEREPGVQDFKGKIDESQVMRKGKHGEQILAESPINSVTQRETSEQACLDPCCVATQLRYTKVNSKGDQLK